jgi:hypothetical protein
VEQTTDETEKITFKHLHEIPPISISLGRWPGIRQGPGGTRPRYVVKPLLHEACPAGNDIEGFMVLTREGKYREAWDLIKERKPFPESVKGLFSPVRTFL